MKKKSLLMLLATALVITSTVGLGSCKKNQTESNAKDVPNVVTTVYYSREDIEYPRCPYCNAIIPPGTTNHYHNFGVDAMGVVGEFPVDGCLSAYGPDEVGCLYSGHWEGNASMIAALMLAHPEWDDELAYEMTRPRFHRHYVHFDLFNGSGSDIGNTGHIGGGVNWWP